MQPPTGGFPRSVTADLDGRYEFTDVPAGDYRITAGKPGYLALEFGQQRAFEHGKAMTIRAGETLEKIDITLPVSGAISGRIFDANGDPVEGIDVRLMQLQFAANRRRVLFVAGVRRRRTNDQGQYRLYGVPPGQYMVMTSVADQPAAQTSVILPPGYAATAIRHERRVADECRDRPDEQNLRHRRQRHRCAWPRRDGLHRHVFATRADPWYQESRFFTFTRPKVDGTFAVTDLPSGEYYVAAVDWLQGTEGLWRVAGPGVPGIDRAAGHARDPGRRAAGGSHGATHHSLNLVPSDLQKISFSDS